MEKRYIFQLLSTAVKLKRLSEVICPLASLMQDQVEEGNSWSLNCSALQGVKYFLSSLQQIIFALAEQALDSLVPVTSNGS